MKVFVAILRFILYIPIVLTEYTLMCLLEIIRYIKKPLEQR